MTDATRRDLADDAARAIDISDRQRLLLKTGALQDAILSSANFSSIATDENGVIQLLNVGAERMLGWAAHEVVNRITDQLAEPHSASAWAAELGMSESRFSRFFRKATGNTFTDFVNRVRISRACQLLMDTDQQITHICYEVGFNSVANFNRRFLEIKGIKPSDFRRQSLTRFRGAH